LESHELEDFIQNEALLAQLIQRNVTIKSEVVSRDEFEQGERKLLNFGHTLAHAIENIYHLPHGFAVSIGMATATMISVHKSQLSTSEQDRILRLIQQYKLPVSISISSDHALIMKNLKMDKKRSSDQIDFILLEEIGKAVIKPITYTEVEDFIISSSAATASAKIQV
jgi:3-dehydroquinate synthase